MTRRRQNFRSSWQEQDVKVLTPTEPTGPLYLTDAERSYRPKEMADQYRIWLRFKIRQTLYCRWFRSLADLETFRRTLPPFAELFDQGERHE